MESSKPIKFCLERWLKLITCLYGSSARDLWCSGLTFVDRNIIPSAQVLKHGSNGHYEISFLDIHNVSNIIRPVVTAHQACCSWTTSKLYEALQNLKSTLLRWRWCYSRNKMVQRSKYHRQKKNQFRNITNGVKDPQMKFDRKLDAD